MAAEQAMNSSDLEASFLFDDREGYQEKAPTLNNVYFRIASFISSRMQRYRTFVLIILPKHLVRRIPDHL